MVKLLARKGIRSVAFVDADNIMYNFFYTDKLLAFKTYIEFHQLERKEVSYINNEEVHPRYQTCIIAFVLHKKDAYEFTVLFDTRRYVPALYCYRIILDLVGIIENSDHGSLIQNLGASACSSLSSIDCRAIEGVEQEFKEKAAVKFGLVLKLIEQSKIEGN